MSPEASANYSSTSSPHIVLKAKGRILDQVKDFYIDLGSRIQQKCPYCWGYMGGWEDVFSVNYFSWLFSVWGTWNNLISIVTSVENLCLELLFSLLATLRNQILLQPRRIKRLTNSFKNQPSNSELFPWEPYMSPPSEQDIMDNYNSKYFCNKNMAGG